MKKLPRMLRPSNLEQPLKTSAEEDVKGEFVGSEIRALRNARDITLKKLCKETGLSLGYISQIERGISEPTIEALHSISRALGVTISWFFKSAEKISNRESSFIVRADARRKLKFDSGITDELLSPTLERNIEMLLCHFEPGAESGVSTYSHRGEESGLIVSGSLELWVANSHFLLKKGDSFAFESHLPHRYRNSGKKVAVVVWAISPPSY